MKGVGDLVEKAAKKEKQVLAAGYTKTAFNEEWVRQLREEWEREDDSEVGGCGEWGVDGVEFD